jgi:hypothetical protein
MEIIINSIRNVVFGLTVMVVNIPIFWSFEGVIDLIQDTVKFIGTGVLR